MTIECMYAVVSVALALAVGALVISRITISTLKEALIKLEDPLPVMYDLQTSGKVPLGKLSPVIYRNYKEIELKDKVAIAGDFITDSDNKNKFTLVVVTDKGIFVRTTKPGNSVITKDVNSIKVKVNWAVYFGQDMLMHNAFIVYKDIIMGRVTLKNSKMLADDALNVTYTFDV